MVADPRAESDPREEQRQRVLDTAALLFATHGFDDVTMAEIAEHAGVARATVFNYFGTKHALVEGITEGVLTFYRSMLDEALADEETPTPLLTRRLCEVMAAGIESQRRLHRSVFREIARIQLGLDASEIAARANEEAGVRLGALMERGQLRGELTTELSADALANAFHSLTNGTITNWLFNDASGPLTDRLREAVEVFLAPVELEREPRASAKGASR